MADTGFRKMDEDEHKAISSEGGKQGGKASSTGNRSSQDMSKIGKKGAQAQSTEDKAKGGHNSHISSDQ